MSSLLSAELSATCNALGTLNKKTGKYMIDDFTLNTVKDLIRYLRRDGEDHEIRRHFGQTKVLQTDLLPMLIDHWENEELFDVTLRLVVNLTNPALLLYREEVPVERTARHNYLQILTHLQSYKEDAFTKVDTWQLFAKKLGKVLEIDWSERDEDTGLIIERILILIRNVLHVPADLDKERRPENDASVHDQVLWALNQAGILDIILYMSSENEKQYFMHIIEIISHLLREQNPTSLADAALQRSVDEKLRDDQELLSIRMTENTDRMNKVQHYSATRHSRFGGTYVVQNMKSISDNELICLKPLNKISNLDFNGSKKSKLVKPKNRRPVESGTMERRSAFAIRLFLKEFCIEFLNSSYNPLMHYVKDILVRAKAQQNDESYYLWAVKFFMEFNRGHNFQVGLVSETMSVPMFYYVQQQMEKYYDMIKVEKKKFSNWVRRLHLALRAYKELLHTLLAMDNSNDVSVRESAKVLKTNMFYVLEYREFILTIFMNYDENKMPRSYLVDLVETVHLFLKMLEHYCKKTGLVVQKKVRKKTKTKKQKPTPKPRVTISHTPWEEIRPQLAAVLSAGIQHYLPPFDAASDTHIDEQKEDCMKKVQKLMRDYKYEDAIGTFRAAREVWPEDGIFGVSGIPEDEELDMLESVYNTDLGVELENINQDTHENSEEDEEDDDEEEDERTTSVVETDFDFQDFVLRFCNTRVISACVCLLERYDKNMSHTNHCIVKMLHRIAYDCNRPTMMFQGTLFLTFQKILHNPMPHLKELEKFSIFILRKFAEIASKSNKVFIELLFWKNSKDAVEIEHGYNIYDDPRDKLGKGGWTEEQEDELRNIYMENQSNPQTDQDVIDWILENLIDQSRTRRSVIKKLKELGLIFNAPTKKNNKQRKEKIPKEFSEEENQMLTELWTQHGDSTNNSDSELSKSDSEDDVRPKTTSLKIKTKKKLTKTTPSFKKTNKKSVESMELSANEIAKLLVQAVDKGHTEALNWLSENLEEVALDQEAEGFEPSVEGTVLVPISRDCVFRCLLFESFRDKLGKGGWTEEQEDELRNIYMENQSNPQTDQDVIDWILENLIDQSRTRRSVIKKLKELGLIFNAPTKKNNKERKEKVPKEFSEEENQMLTELWTQHGDSTNPMGMIIPLMTRNRPKQHIIERLIELGLIENKKQCQKKRIRNKSNHNSSDSELSKSDSEDDARPKTTSLKIKTKTKLTKTTPSFKKPNKKSVESMELSANEIAKLLVQAVDKGHTEALNWLSENLEEVALDQEAEGFEPSVEGTVLVPISRDCVQAMQNDLFIKVLKSVGIVPPEDEQEIYWRIPSRLHYDTIRKRREIIIKAINKELIIDNTIVLPENNKENNINNENTTNNKDTYVNNNNSDGSDDDLFNNLRKMTNNNNENHVINKSRKRTRSVDSNEENNKKMQRIEEVEENDEDILSFVKNTLHTELPDTEDILNVLPEHSDDSEGEVAPRRRKLRVISDSE